jgi:hypothetical protein
MVILAMRMRMRIMNDDMIDGRFCNVVGVHDGRVAVDIEVL